MLTDVCSVSRCRNQEVLLAPGDCPGSQHEPLVSVTFRGSRSSFPSLCVYLLEGQPTGKGQGRGQLEVGPGCISDSISKYLEHSGGNASQQMNTPQVLVEKNPTPTSTCAQQHKTLLGVFLHFFK